MKPSQFTCTKCYAPSGEPCREFFETVSFYHAERIDAALDAIMLVLEGLGKGYRSLLEKAP